jgi:hypothetical protein
MSFDTEIRQRLHDRATRIQADVDESFEDVVRRGQLRRRTRRIIAGTSGALVIFAAALLIPRWGSRDAVSTPVYEGQDSSPTTGASERPDPTEAGVLVRSGVRDGHRWQLLASGGNCVSLTLREFDASGWNGSGGTWCDVPEPRDLGQPVIVHGVAFALASERVASVRIEIVDEKPIQIETMKITLDALRTLSVYYTELPKGAHVIRTTALDGRGEELDRYDLPADGPPADYTDPPRPT